MPEKEKKIALDKLRKARTAHLTWRSYAQCLAQGMDVTKAPVESTDCAFGQWYLGEGKEKLEHLSSYEGIRAPHEKLHELYHQIFHVIHSAEGVTGLKGFFTSRSAQEKSRLEKAKQYMEELMSISEVLLDALEVLEQEIRQADGCC